MTVRFRQILLAQEEILKFCLVPNVLKVGSSVCVCVFVREWCVFMREGDSVCEGLCLC